MVLIMPRITAVSAGAVDYLLRGSGCAEHQHERSTEERERSGAEYLLSGAEVERDRQERTVVGVWRGQGLHMIGLTEGAEASEAAVRAVFGALAQPGSNPDAPDFLGSPPRNFRSVKEREDAAIAAEPGASEERQRAIRGRVRATQRQAVAYYDVTFAPPKSVSILHTALLVGGRENDAARVMGAHDAAVDKAMRFIEREVAYTRSGYHGKASGGGSVGVFERGTGLVWMEFQHETSRAQEPHIHTHVPVSNRVVTVRDGEIRALDGRGFGPIKEGAEAIYQQEMRRGVSQAVGVVFALRPDGKAQEVLGIDRSLIVEASSRSVQVEGLRDDQVEAYTQRYGRPPSPAQRKQMWNEAKLRDRPAKVREVSAEQQLRNWAEPRQERLAYALVDVAVQAAGVAATGHPDQRGYAERTLEQVLTAAVERAQAQYATWTVGNLIAAIYVELERTPAVGDDGDLLSQQVLADGARYGLVQLTALDPAPVPAELQREDGRNRYTVKPTSGNNEIQPDAPSVGMSVAAPTTAGSDREGKSTFRPHNDERYATADQLSTELGIVARAAKPGAPAIGGTERELTRVELIGAGLGSDQAEAVLGILSSGRGGDVLIGPAGVGKSRTMGVLAGVWETRFGGRVLGLATSQIATSVLADDGLDAVNTTVFVNRFTPDAQGRVRDRIRPGDLVIIDEANMSGTPELEVVSRIIAEGGGKLVYTGDTAQLASVGAGGMLQLLVTDLGAFELSEVHRFTHDWEKQATLRLRDGDISVLDVYEDHGRIRGGTEAEMTAAAAAGYLADTLEGKTSLVVVRSNAMATELSAQIRHELVRLGRVAPEVLATSADGNPIGIGDRIQARRNDRTIRADGAGMVTNKDTYAVLDRNPLTGELRVQDKTGMIAHLPPGYVTEHVTLAYAVTSYAAEGVTETTSHDLVDTGTTRAGVYVPGTRGRERNTFYGISQQARDAHNPEGLDTTARDLLERALGRGGGDTPQAAELLRRTQLELAQSLPIVTGQWDKITEDHSTERDTATLGRLLGAEQLEHARGEYGFGRLLRAVRAPEMAGHDPTTVLTAAVTSRPLRDANSVTDVLRWRVQNDVARRTPERDVDAGDWARYSAGIEGPVGEYVAALAVLATQRQDELGAAVLAERPGWAREYLEEPSSDQRQQDEWVRRAGMVALYRELAGTPDTSLALGPEPEPEKVYHHALWNRAYVAMGAPADELSYAAASDTELRDIRATWEREQGRSPYWVAGEVQQAELLAQEYRQDAVLWWVETDRIPQDSPERVVFDADTARAEQLAAHYTARAEQLQTIHTARQVWSTDPQVAQLEQQAEHAARELHRRGLNPDPVTLQPEQLELIGVVEPDQAPEPADAGRGHGRDQHEHATGRDRGTDAVREAAQIGAQARAERLGEHLITQTVPREPAEPDRAPAGPDREPTGPGRGSGRDQHQQHTHDSARLGPDLYRAGADPARVEIDPDQHALFPAEPRMVDVAAAQPLRPEDPQLEQQLDAEQGVEVAGPVTVGEALRQAAISAELRPERALDHAINRSAVDWELDRDRDTTHRGADARRRDQHERERTRTPEHDRMRGWGLDPERDKMRGWGLDPERDRMRGWGIEPTTPEENPDVGIDVGWGM